MSLPPRGEGDGAPGGIAGGAAIPMGPPVSNVVDTEGMIQAIMVMGFSREAAQLVRLT